MPPEPTVVGRHWAGPGRLSRNSSPPWATRGSHITRAYPAGRAVPDPRTLYSASGALARDRAYGDEHEPNVSATAYTTAKRGSSGKAAQSTATGRGGGAAGADRVGDNEQPSLAP